MEKGKRARAVQFEKYGGIDVLKVVEVERPAPGRREVLVRVKAAGINPGEGAIREGKFAKRWPSSFPSGEGSDLAGIVEEVGAGVDDIAVGDEVIGFTDKRASHADFVIVDADHLVPRPAKVPWEQAGALFVVGTTAYAAIKAVGLKPRETLVVSGAAGGVGSLVVQLAKNIGAKVIGLASVGHHKWFSDRGIIPVAYGEGVFERILEASGGRVDAFIDTHGDGYVELAIKLGVSPERIDTIIDFAAAEEYGAKTAGNHDAASAEVLGELAELMAMGRLEVPIAGVYPLADVRDAFRELEKHHTHGKIVLVP